jgi:hypothetical protein
MAQSFRFPASLRNLALIILLGAKLGDRRFWEKLAVLCAAAGILTECLSEGKLLASDSLRHKALRAINSPENSFVVFLFYRSLSAALSFTPGTTMLGARRDTPAFYTIKRQCGPGSLQVDASLRRAQHGRA